MKPADSNFTPRRHVRLRSAGAWSTTLLALLAGCSPTTEPTQPETVTTTVAASPQPAETVTEQVEVAPQSCLDALDSSEDLRNQMGEFIVLYQQVLAATRKLDAQAIDDVNTDLEGLNDRVEESRQDYDTLADDCRSST